MTIAAVTPPDAASDPAHPEHDRWVKEVTLRREVEHAQLVGLPLHVAEAENRRLLERADRIAADQKPVARQTKAPQFEREKRMQERGVVRRKPAARRGARACACGKCVPCKRNVRILALFQRKQAGDVSVRALVSEMGSASLAASAGVGSFKGLSKADARRALAVIVDSICDRSVAWMGPWR